jgi:hypothetical protein|nr:MAG TPA: hypothetical protein [Caudoviricetes sp.]
MPDVISTYMGMIMNEDKMKQYIDISRFANTNDNNPLSPKSQFTILPQFTTNINGFEGGCDGVIPGCIALSTVEIEVQDEIWVAELLDGCSVIDTNFIMSQLGVALAQRLQRLIVKARAQYFFNKILTPIKDTNEVIGMGINELVANLIASIEAQGYDRDYITLVIGETVANEVSASLHINNQYGGTSFNDTTQVGVYYTIEQVLKGLFNVSDVVVVPDDVIAGNYDKENQADYEANVVALIKDYSLFKVYCETQPTIEMVDHDGYGAFLRKQTPMVKVFGRLGAKTVMPNTVFYGKLETRIQISQGTTIPAVESKATTSSKFNKKNNHETKAVKENTTK